QHVASANDLKSQVICSWHIGFDSYLAVHDEVKLISPLGLVEDHLAGLELCLPRVSYENIEVIRIKSLYKGMLSNYWLQIFHNIPFAFSFRDNLTLLQRVLSPSFGRSLAHFARRDRTRVRKRIAFAKIGRAVTVSSRVKLHID